jgi:hypothetical protein
VPCYACGVVRIAVVSLPLVLVCVFVLAGCGLFGGKAGQQGRAQQAPPELQHLDVTLVSRCARPVVVCYGGDSCLTLSGSAPHVVHAATTGNTVFVSLKDSPSNAEADVTFSMVEVDVSCAHLDRRLRPR